MVKSRWVYRKLWSRAQSGAGAIADQPGSTRKAETVDRQIDRAP